MIIKMSESKSIKEGMNWTNGEEEYEIASTLASAPVNSIIFIKKSYGGKNRTLKFEKVSTNKWVSLNKFNDRTDSYESDKSLKDKYIDGATWKLEKAVNESKSIKEAANPDNADLNMKIAKTLATKLTKEPKYRADLEAAGFELYDSDWSTYKNWAVKGPNGKSVVLSKGYDNKPRIYNSANSLATKDAINVFDFVNYLTMDFTDRHDYRAHGGIGRTNGDVYVRMKDGSAVDADFSPKTKTQQYHDLQKSVKDAKWDIDYYSREIDRIHTQIAQLQKDADRYLDSKSMSKDKLMTKLAEIDTLLKSMGVRSAEESLKMRIKESDDYIDSPKYIADRYLDFDIPDMCADTLKVLDNMSESTLAELISACRTFYNTLDEICTLHS